MSHDFSERRGAPSVPAYRRPAARHVAEIVIERSRFICTLDRATTAEDAQRIVRDVQVQAPEATHHCWAYVAGPPGSTSHIGLSDDGEPHGTAGRPMLNVLLHADVGDIVAVVTRWYGGVKLGTGGLSRAYAGAVQTALSTLPLELRVDRVRAAFVVDYAAITPVRQLLDALEVEVLQEDWADVVAYEVAIARDRIASLTQGLADRTRGRAVPTVTELSDGSA